MDNKEAIKIINQYDMNFHWNDGEPIPAEQLVEAFDLAIAALEQREKAFDEWCTDCKEYDHEKHCCPRFNRVIRDTLNEVEPMRKRGTWMHDKDDVLISGYCSCCGWESIIMETDVADMPFCPNCGADMRGEQE